MEKNIRLLAVLLGVQVLLAFGLWLGGGNLSAKTDNSPLLALKGKTVDHIVIDSPGKAKVTMTKVKGNWTLPDHDNFPADGSRIERLLTHLKEFKQGVPVANSKEARERFKVSDKVFERRITLRHGTDTLATLYVGTSVGREAHIRKANEKTIHLVKFNAYDAPVTVDEWEDKTILQIPKDKIVAVETNGLRLERITKAETKTDKTETKKPEKPAAAKPSPTWQIAGSVPGTLKPDAADKLVDLVAELRIGSVLGEAEQPSYGLKTPKLTLSVTRKNGKDVAYRFGKMADKEQYVLKVSDRPEYFRVPVYTVEPLMKAAKQQALLERTAMAKSGMSGHKK